MATELSVTHERLDDIPVIFGMARKLGLPEVLDEALGRHGNQEGLSYGWLATIWLAYMLAEGDHRKSVVEEWAQRKKVLLSMLTGQTVRDHELSDDRLGQLLSRLSDPQRWDAIERSLWSRSALAYQLDCRRVRLDSTTSYGYHEVGEEGLMQLGHSKDHRPDKPQLKLMVAVAEPAGQMLCSTVHPGHRADDGLYEPMIERVRQIAGTGLLYIGDAKMAAQATREAVVAGGDHYLTRLPKVAQKGEMDRWIGRALDGDAKLEIIHAEDGSQLGEGYGFNREVTGTTATWTERVIVYRSDALAERHRTRLQIRLQEATAALLALTPPVGRGRRQFRSVQELTEAIDRIEAKHQVRGLLWLTWETEPWPTRDEPDRVRFVVTAAESRVKQIEVVSRGFGWQALVTSMPVEALATADAVPVYNAGWQIEQQFRDIKNRPLGIRPLHVTREDQIIGLTHLVTLALRIMTLIATTVRRSLARTGEVLHGLYEGQKVRTTAQPTGRRLLKAFHRHEITLTRIRAPGQDLVHVAPLPPALSAILKHLGLSDALYTDLAVAAK